MNTSEGSANNSVHLDPENPWLGLFSYSEETRAYFHGRDEEIAELARRVQRKLLSVLFGQSGLGKTSLLRAGLVPRLRAEGFCPVYVRVDYAPDSPSPSEQIKQAILKASAEAGYWSQAGVAVEGESLWEFMHHRGDLLRDAEGRTLMPLLIFDQFEEIFTLGQMDDAGRLRARQFLEDLADLAENRPPAALEARIEHDDEAAANFDFARADYRILIALREDYLAHLESVKGSMPSITQNRMRLARMNGTQALSAVVKPGGRLVSQEVAEAIVRFVAGGSELSNAEIEPSLLSLICRELNTVRLAQGRAEISADLLAGSRDTILSEFYERALADQPAGVRRVVEDELLTDSGYRESLAEERVVKSLAAAGAAPDALPTLVNRRVLRIEDRLDMRRVELTHDVLCSVVLASRELRHEREARDEAQRQLVIQQEREATTKRALVRARMVAGVCGVLMVLAVIGAGFGWINLRRAQAADAQAQRARADAEKLVGFLIEDFYTELEPTGKLETLGKLAHMTVSYYDGLPPELITPRTQSLRAMALIREGAALKASGDVAAAYKNFSEAQTALEKVRAGGDNSDPILYGLALALFNQGAGVVEGVGRGTTDQLRQAADLLRPLAYQADTSRAIKQTYADILNYLSHSQPKETAVETTREGRKLLATLGALDLSDLRSTAIYADTADSEARHLTVLGRLDEAKTLEREVYDLAEKVLVARPGDLKSLSNRNLAAGLLSELASLQHDDAAALDFADRAVQASEDAVRFNPADMGGWLAWVRSLMSMAYLQYDRGEVSQAFSTAYSAMALANDSRLPSSLGPILGFRWFELSAREAEAGRSATSRQALRAAAKGADEYTAQLLPDDPQRQVLADLQRTGLSYLLLWEGDPQAALDSASKEITRLQQISIPQSNTVALNIRDLVLRRSMTTAAVSSLKLNRYAQAEALAREILKFKPDPNDNPETFNFGASATLAKALSMQGKKQEAQSLIQPLLTYYQGQQKAGAKGTVFRHEYANALYVSALAQADDATGRSKRNAELDAAAELIAGTSAEARQMLTVRELADLIAGARQQSPD